MMVMLELAPDEFHLSIRVAGLDGEVTLLNDAM